MLRCYRGLAPPSVICRAFGAVTRTTIIINKEDVAAKPLPLKGRGTKDDIIVKEDLAAKPLLSKGRGKGWGFLLSS